MAERIEQLTAAMSEYGERSIQNMNLCRTLGRAIIDSFDKYLSVKGGLVLGVPAKGDWSGEKGDYRDGAFSFHGGGLLHVNDIQFGMSVRIPNSKDDGSLWMRVIVNLRKQGETFGVFLNDDGPGIWIPVNYSEQDLQQISEKLFDDVLANFRDGVVNFDEGSGQFGTVGFLGTRV